MKVGRAAFPPFDVFYAWLAATVLSGIPSTVYALVTSQDPLEATRAAGAMLLPRETSLLKLVAAAAVIHPVVSLFWAAILAFILPRRYTALWTIIASVGIAMLDLRVIAPRFFPEVAALDFWPQFADHLMWGVCFGATLAIRNARRE